MTALAALYVHVLHIYTHAEYYCYQFGWISLACWYAPMISLRVCCFKPSILQDRGLFPSNSGELQTEIWARAQRFICRNLASGRPMQSGRCTVG